MRVLFLSQVLPYPLDAGPKMRSYFVLRHLVQQHEVTLLTFVRATDRPEDVAHLAKFCHAVHTVPMHRTRWRDINFLTQSLFTQQSFIIVRDQMATMQNKLCELVSAESFEVVHADQLWMAQYALAAKKLAPKTKLILDQHNAVQLIPQRLADDETNPVKKLFLAREARLLKEFESKVCNLFDHVVWVTEEDRQVVEEPSSPNTTNSVASTVIPICADPTQVKPIERAPSGCRITFLGGLHWPPNAEGVLWFAKHVFPQIRARIPEAVLTVIGKNPPAGLVGEGIEVTGYVTDVTPYLVETGVFIVPLHAGGGMRVKILDAWSWGLPIVSTTIGAEGINIQDGKDILIADTAPTFAESVIQILQNTTLAQQLGYNGRRTAIDKYNWRTIYTAWDKVYQGLFNSSEEKINGFRNQSRLAQ